MAAAAAGNTTEELSETVGHFAEDFRRVINVIVDTVITLDLAPPVGLLAAEDNRYLVGTEERREVWRSLAAFGL